LLASRPFLLPCFSVLCSDPLRALPSFPTRRSSDLKKGSALVWFNLHSSGEGDLATLHAACPVLLGSKWVSVRLLHERGQEWRKPDRKSTRLNSSHVSISYAVFCLKKKTRHTDGVA